MLCAPWKREVDGSRRRFATPMCDVLHGLRLRESGNGVPYTRGAGQPMGWGDQVRGQKAMGQPSLAGGTELQALNDPVPKKPSRKIIVLACRCEKVIQTGRKGGMTVWLSRANKFISSGFQPTSVVAGSVGLNSAG